MANIDQCGFLCLIGAIKVTLEQAKIRILDVGAWKKNGVWWIEDRLGNAVKANSQEIAVLNKALKEINKR